MVVNQDGKEIIAKAVPLILSIVFEYCGKKNFITS